MLVGKMLVVNLFNITLPNLASLYVLSTLQLSLSVPYSYSYRSTHSHIMVKLLVLMIIAIEVSAMVHAYPHARHASSCSSHHLSIDAIARARTGLYMYSTSSRGCRRHQRMTSFSLHFDATTTTALESASVIGGLYLLLQLVVYWRMQFVAAGKYAST